MIVLVLIGREVRATETRIIPTPAIVLHASNGVVPAIFALEAVRFVGGVIAPADGTFPCVIHAHLLRYV